MKNTVNTRLWEETWLRWKMQLAKENKKNKTRKTMMEFVNEKN